MINAKGDTKELVPFCGLHKTGDWAMQSQPPSTAPAAMPPGMNRESTLPSMTSSLNTLLSSQDSLATPNSARTAGSLKRTYDEEVEEDLDAVFFKLDAEPKDTDRATRPMAKLKKSPLEPATAPTSTSPVVLTRGDFEDADFLECPESMDPAL